MYLQTLSKQVAPLLAYLVLLPSFQLVSASDSSSPLDPFVNPENPLITGSDTDEFASDDGPTADKSAGIGVEFETGSITFSNSQCSYTDTSQAKGQLVEARQGQYWKLTADTTDDIAGRLTTEYILDGTQLKIGAGTAGPAAAAVAGDFIGFPCFYISKFVLTRSLAGCLESKQWRPS
jgi:hypothetical protein